MSKRSAAAAVNRLVVRLIADDDGQDLIEYALLTAIATAVALVGLPIAEDLGGIYQGWVDGVWDIWIPPPPG
jgi:Flp pilus assembly pilin Flp